MYGGFWKRFLAHLIDWVILAVGSIVILLTWGFIGEGLGYIAGGEATQSVFGVIGVLFYFAIPWLYYAFFESSKYKATPGKMALGMIVVDNDYKKVTFGTATIRFLGKIVSSLILFIGYIMAGFTEHKQALHDMMAEVYVVNKISPEFQKVEGESMTAVSE